MMDFSLMKNPTFLLIGIANLIGMLGFYTPFVYLPAAAIEKVFAILFSFPNYDAGNEQWSKI